MLLRTGMRMHTFPQRMVGAPSLKPTTLTGTMPEVEVVFPSRCTHSAHSLVLSGVDEYGHFRTRQGQTYPPEMCRLIAQCFLNRFLERRASEGEYDTEQDPEGLLEAPREESPFLIGERTAVQIGRAHV